FYRLLPAVVIFVLNSIPLAFGQGNFVDELLKMHQTDLASDGKSLLLKEAAGASFFLIGGIHGDQETQALIQALWPSFEKVGYRYINVEMSPWMADRAGVPTVRGTDMEEAQPHLLIRELSAINQGNRGLESMVDLTKSGYRRSLALQLLDLLHKETAIKDKS